VTNACRLGEYFEAHALAVYDVMGTLPQVEGARRVLAWIERTKPQQFSARDVWQALRGQARFSTMDDLRPALGVLVECGHIRSVPVTKMGAGRPPSPVYVVHPEILQKTSPKSPQFSSGVHSGDYGDDSGEIRGDGTASMHTGAAPASEPRPPSAREQRANREQREDATAGAPEAGTDASEGGPGTNRRHDNDAAVDAVNGSGEIHEEHHADPDDGASEHRSYLEGVQEYRPRTERARRLRAHFAGANNGRVADINANHAHDPLLEATARPLWQRRPPANLDDEEAERWATAAAHADPASADAARDPEERQQWLAHLERLAEVATRRRGAP
jgi:hypothetical protein